MMEILLAFLFCFSLNINTYAQTVKYDYNWVIGYGWKTPENDTITPKDEIILNFNEDPVEIKNIKARFRIGATSTSISDSSGSLEFYTNGCYIANSDLEIIKNGDSLNYGDIYDYVCMDQGYISSQGVLAIPLLNNNKYLLFHTSFFFRNRELLDFAVKGFYYSIVDKVNGHWEMTKNNIPLLQNDTVIYSGSAAVRHANGRDWWVIVPLQKSDEFVLYLVTETGIQSNKRIRSGVVNSGYTGAIQHKFSPNGKYYAFADRKDNGLILMKFDRCKSEFFTATNIPRPIDPIISQYAGVEFSPDSRYLYAHYNKDLYQYDLEADNIEKSREIVASYDRINHEFHAISCMQLAPDGRIYTAALNGVKNLNIIREPNKKGLDCDFRFQGVITQHNNWFSLNNVPNYRLGPEEGTVCDSLNLNQGAVAHWRSDTIKNNRKGRRFTDLSYFNPESWLWNFGDGTTSTEINPEHTYKDTGIYYVCLKVSNKYGSHSECRNIRISDIISSNLDESEFIRQEVYLFPNPASDEVLLQFDRPIEEDGLYKLYDIKGKEILSGSINKACFNKVINLDHVNDGIYVLSIRTKTGRIMNTKLIVSKI